MLPPGSPPLEDDRAAEVSLAGQAAALPAGLYRLALRLVAPGETLQRTTNPVALTIAPLVTNLPLVVPREADGSAIVTVTATPVLREGQRAVLILGSMEYEPQGGAASPAGELTFIVADAAVGAPTSLGSGSTTSRARSPTAPPSRPPSSATRFT